MKSNSKIAVVGKMHSGKTTFAEALVRLGYRRFAFADPVKEIGAAMLTTFRKELSGYGCVYTYDDINEMKGHPAIRKLLQLVGTELGREWHGPDTIWIDKFEQRVEAWEWENRHLRSFVPIVNDDCRFPNEAQRLTDLGFTVIKLHRNETERRQSVIRALKAANPKLSTTKVLEIFDTMMAHPSETNVDLIDANVDVASLNIEQLQALASFIASGGDLCHELPSNWKSNEMTRVPAGIA